MDVPATMEAAYLERTGGPEQIMVGPLPVPRPGPTDLLVRMEASEVNNVDLFVRSGAYRTATPFPFVIGRDLVGTVVDHGSGVTGFAAGERIWCNSLGHHGRQGAFSEYAVVPEDRAYRLPDGVEPKGAASVLHAAGTAYLGLIREAGLHPGETVFVGGAGGAVGTAVTQIAVAAGARVVTTCGPDDMDWCRACGADQVIDYHDADQVDQIRAASPGGIDVWFDTSGHNDFEATLPLLRRRARVVVMSGLQGASPRLPVGELYTRDASLHGFAISNASVAALAEAAQLINTMLGSGRLRSRIGATYRLRDARRAHEDLQSHAVRGRIVVVP